MKTKLTDYLNDAINHGCLTGLLGVTNTQEETTAFYHQHKDELHRRLHETLLRHGLESPSELFGKAWDYSDPAAQEIDNITLLAGFAYEDAVSEVLHD